jgi:ribosome-interacting GTPase 1
VTKSVRTGRGVRQGCSLSPLSFNLYSEYVTQEALEGLGDFKVGRQIISTVRYADDLVLLAKEETILQSMIDTLIEVGRDNGMEINVDKTKTMRLSRQPSPLQIKKDKKLVEKAQEFNYLGRMITNDARCT